MSKLAALGKYYTPMSCALKGVTTLQRIRKFINNLDSGISTSSNSTREIRIKSVRVYAAYFLKDPQSCIYSVSMLASIPIFFPPKMKTKSSDVILSYEM